MRLVSVHTAAHPVRRGFAVFALLVSGALIAAGCGGSGNGGSSASPGSTAAPAEPSPSVATTAGGSAGTTEPTIEGSAFHPDQIAAKVGQKVTWTNDDSTNHTVTADDSAFDSSALAQGKSFSFTFDKAGTFKYHCSIHTSMTGTVVIT